MKRRILVCSKLECEQLINKPYKGSNVRYIISIGDPGENPPRNLYASGRHVLRLTFYDGQPGRTGSGYMCARTEDIRKIINFARQEIKEDEIFVVHCSAGISRSTAVSWIVSCLQRGPGYEAEELQALFEEKSCSLPNPWIITLAQSLLPEFNFFTPLLESKKLFLMR